MDKMGRVGELFWVPVLPILFSVYLHNPGMKMFNPALQILLQ